MKNYLYIIYLIACTLFFYNCIGSAYDKKLNGGYYLSAMDTKTDMEIEYLDGDYMFALVNSTVFAVGQNDEFIIAKQHPSVFPNESDKKITNYFIIPLKNKISKLPEKNIYGPLNKKEFKQKTKELKIDKLEFNIVFKDLE